MRNLVALSALSLLCIPAGASAEEDPSAMVQAIKGATACALAASKTGVEKARFETDTSWKRQADGGYLAEGQPVTISFPPDDDGVSRICVVEATLPSQDLQAQMQIALETLLKRKPIKQKDSLIWMFGSGRDARGLQFFPDKQSDSPEFALSAPLSRSS